MPRRRPARRRPIERRVRPSPIGRPAPLPPTVPRRRITQRPPTGRRVLTPWVGRVRTTSRRPSEVFPVAVKLQPGDSKVLVERDGLRLVARCTSNVGTTSGGTADVLTVLVESSTDGASFSAPKNELDGSMGNALGPSTPESKRIAIQQSANSGVKVVRVPPAAVSATSSGGTSIFLGSGGTTRVGFNLFGAVCSISAPVMVSTL